jgi:hypothetical protein
MRHVVIKGRVDKEFVERALRKVDKLIGIPEGVNILVFDNPKYCTHAAERVSKAAGRAFVRMCKEDKTSMSLTYGSYDIVIIHITKVESYMRHNFKALVGTMLHEVMHTIERRKGLDLNVRDDAIAAYEEFLDEMPKLPYPPKVIADLFASIGRDANHVLKDVYVNTELVKRGLGDYVFEDYYNLYSHKGRCPAPVFYQDLKKDIKKDVTLVRDVIDFELTLFSILAPFLLEGDEGVLRARKLFKQIAECYEVNIAEVAYLLDPTLRYLGEKLKDTSRFRKAYFKKVFRATLRLLTYPLKK